MNAEADLHAQLTAIDPAYAITLDNRLWTCRVRAPGQDKPVLFVHIGKLQAMDGALGKARRLIAEKEVKERL